jgi:hypothetical protein
MPLHKMASTFAVTRNHLIFGLCLPLAILMGYLLAEPMDRPSLVVLVVVMSVLAIPILMRWHFVLLILSWHSAVQLNFIPGGLRLWVALSFLSVLFAVLSRSVNIESKFINEPSITKPLFALLAVFVITAVVRGGLGMRVFGSGAYGGKGYLLVVASVVGYFGLTCRTIPAKRARLLVSLFFLTGVTALMSNLAWKGGPGLNFLFNFFPVEYALDQATAEISLTPEHSRISSMVLVGMGIFSFLMTRYGADGVFAFSRPWRMVLFALTLVAIGFAGFRSLVILMGMTFLIMFMVQGLWRTRVLLIVACAGTLLCASLMAVSDKLPIPVQRTLSFLPMLEIDPITKMSAEASTDWRLEIWREAVKLVPKYFFMGKGYVINPDELEMALQSAQRGNTGSWEGALLAGDYHNGPLSVVIPFGIYGVLVFAWFVVASIRLLWRYVRNSPPELWRINAFLLSLFVARILFFVFIFGSFQSELFYFTGIIGVAVALNGRAANVVRDEDNQNIEDSEPVR